MPFLQVQFDLSKVYRDFKILGTITVCEVNCLDYPGDKVESLCWYSTISRNFVFLFGLDG